MNKVSPVYVIVANDGSSVATFDNWYSTGYGENVFVIYDEEGNALKTCKLEEISPFPLDEYMISVTSIHWRKPTRYVNNKNIEIHFINSENQIIERNYNLSIMELE
jgi:hypothetical protein